MDTHEAIRTRRTAHVWKDTEVPESVVERALAAAHMAPCHRFTWPWRFTRVGSEGRDHLFEMALVIKSKGNPQTAAFREKIKKKVRNPAHLIVVSQEHKEDAFEAKEDYAAISCAIQNMALSIHADGFASKWSTGGLTTHPDTYRLLGIQSERESIVGFVWIGAPELEGIPAPKRTNLEEHIRSIP